jgi:hypothetical protein
VRPTPHDDTPLICDHDLIFDASAFDKALADARDDDPKILRTTLVAWLKAAQKSGRARLRPAR